MDGLKVASDRTRIWAGTDSGFKAAAWAAGESDAVGPSGPGTSRHLGPLPCHDQVLPHPRRPAIEAGGVWVPSPPHWLHTLHLSPFLVPRLEET